jgi:ethanolamine phosphate phosphodiesterase
MAGNHDVNFHYAMHPYLINRFNKAFNTSGVRLIKEKKTTTNGTVRTINFVSVNSMALERDGCSLCNEAEQKLKQIKKKMILLKNHNTFSKPIMLQHFPTYRPSDEQCLEKDSVNLDVYREKWETLSREASDFIQETLDPVIT